MFEDPELKSAEKDSGNSRSPFSGPAARPMSTESAATPSAGLWSQVPPGQKADARAAAQVLSHWAEGVTAPESPTKQGDDPQQGGPLPEMSGIATNLAIGRFVNAAKDVQRHWGKLKVDERAQQLGKAANEELKAARVTEATPVVMDIDSAGKFGIATWTLKLGKKAFSAAAVTDAEAADVADTVYHESRHAEQWYRMARLEAGKQKSADQIQKSMGIPARVAQDAYKEPLEAGSSEGKEANTWWESVYGSNAKERSEILKSLNPLEEAVDKAQADYDKIKSDPAVSADKKSEAFSAWTGAYDKWKENSDKYHALPEEADAWKVGGKVTSTYLGK